MPDRSYPIEHDLWQRGYARLAGLDEAGRGCLAGPVVAAAVILAPEQFIDGVDDSKKLSPKKRDVMARRIQDEALAVGVGLCTPAEIDRLNILHAAMEAMRRAVLDLPSAPDYLLVDGNRCFPEPEQPHATVVKGDRHCHCIAAASIIAKTTRDRLMADLHADVPHYAWAQNKGYPTKDHYAALAEHGPSVYHRRSFKLIR